MIECFIKIGEEDAEGVDIAEKYGFYYYKSDTIFEAPLKKDEPTTYAEEEGEHNLNKFVDDAFDYNISFLVSTKGEQSATNNANAKIETLNKAFYTKNEDEDVKTYKQIELYNTYKRVKIVGTPRPIREVSDKDFYRDSEGKVADAVVVGLTIRVQKPSLCSFNYQQISTKIS